MAWRCTSSLTRSLISPARSSSIRPSSLPRLRRSSPLHTDRLQSRRSLLRTIGTLGGSQSLMPLHSVVGATRLASHITVDARACCELSQGYALVTFISYTAI
ncbi:hypothetical protein Pint_27961 [Pistacia integerrima]|uniref:Uncharacterized protein n=1 Tax=Pistacia integerrima TaxID=434235 RepID=A0ACC0YV21_9ROSI|nr:hypothetical protein Pint_27961 [Pistacia integerrima]